MRPSPKKSSKFEPIHTVYQPILHISTGKVLGYEALTRGRGRWELPEDLFRRSYEEGFMTALDLECMWRALRILPKLGSRKLLFVNAEPTTLCHAFAKGREGDLLLRKVSRYSRQIVFELTEGMKGRDFPLLKRGVSFLKKKHFRFAIDDVAGIGSKLFRLLSLRPNFLKVDISLVKGLGENRLQQGLVSRLVDLGTKYDCLVIAEGVERKGELAFVRRMGIPYAQGFYFAHPKPYLETP